MIPPPIWLRRRRSGSPHPAKVIALANPGRLYGTRLELGGQQPANKQVVG